MDNFAAHMSYNLPPIVPPAINHRPAPPTPGPCAAQSRKPCRSPSPYKVGYEHGPAYAGSSDSLPPGVRRSFLPPPPPPARLNVAPIPVDVGAASPSPPRAMPVPIYTPAPPMYDSYEFPEGVSEFLMDFNLRGAVRGLNLLAGRLDRGDQIYTGGITQLGMTTIYEQVILVLKAAEFKFALLADKSMPEAARRRGLEARQWITEQILTFNGKIEAANSKEAEGSKYFLTTEMYRLAVGLLHRCLMRVLAYENLVERLAEERKATDSDRDDESDL